MTDYFPHTNEELMPENETPAPLVTQDDIAGLLAVAEFLDALDLEGDAAEKLRDLSTRLSRLILLA